MVPIHPMVLEKKFVLHISHRVAMLNYVPRIGFPTWLPGAIKASDWLKCLMIFFSSPILHGVWN
jgi:hypothetical protein